MDYLDTFFEAMAMHPFLIIGAIAVSVLLTAVAVIMCCCEPWAGEDEDVMAQVVGDAPRIDW